MGSAGSVSFVPNRSTSEKSPLFGAVDEAYREQTGPKVRHHDHDQGWRFAIQV